MHFAERVALGPRRRRSAPAAAPPAPARDAAGALDRYEAELIREALRAHAGESAATIEALGIPRKTFYDKLKRHGIQRTDFV